MYCSKCGRELPEGSRFCPNCGNSVDSSTPIPAQTSSGQEQNAPSTEQQNIPPASEQSTPPTSQQNIPPVSEQDAPPVPNEEIKCPKCGATGCTPQYKQNVSGGGYGCCSGGLGALVLGPLGLLCGACGRSVKSTNTLVWICPKCGHEFQAITKESVFERLRDLIWCVFGSVAFLSYLFAIDNEVFTLICVIGVASCWCYAIYLKTTLPENPLTCITEEQKQKLKKTVVVLGVIVGILALMSLWLGSIYA